MRASCQCAAHLIQHLRQLALTRTRHSPAVQQLASPEQIQEQLLEEQLEGRYTTLCDPRLNARQALDLAFRLAELMLGGPSRV